MHGIYNNAHARFDLFDLDASGLAEETKNCVESSRQLSEQQRMLGQIVFHMTLTLKKMSMA